MSRIPVKTICLCCGIVLTAVSLRGQEAKDRDRGVSADQVAKTRQSLRRDESRSLPDSGGDELDAAIREIEAIRLPGIAGVITVGESTTQSAENTEEAKAATKQVTTRPASTEPAKRKSAGAKMILVASSKSPKSPAMEKLVEQLRNIPSESIENAIPLADALFLGGHIEAATAFYAKALSEEKDNDARAWVLFQLANCCKSSDPVAARGYYSRLLSEHSDSEWKSAAEIQDRLLEWRMINQPQKCLKRVAKELDKS